MGKVAGASNNTPAREHREPQRGEGPWLAGGLSSTAPRGVRLRGAVALKAAVFEEYLTTARRHPGWDISPHHVP